MSAAEKTMNCEDFKQAIAADPSVLPEGAAEHAAGCESCAAFRADMRALDTGIAKALMIKAPELRLPELPPIEDDNVHSLPYRRKSRTSTWIAIAASFALAAIIGMQMVGNQTPGDYSLAEEVLAHLDHEPTALRVTDVAVSEDRLARVVNPSIGSMDRDVGLITYAASCVINGRTVPHLVMQGEKGPITLLLMPDEMVEGASTLDGESVTGVILPVGNGSIAIIGERDENIAEIEQKVIDSVEWSI